MGPRALALSLVVLAPHYSHLLYDDLPSLLGGDVHFYDTHGVYDRLPHRMPLELGGPTTREGLTIWLSLAGAAIAAALLARQRARRRGIVLFGTTALVLTLVELYTTWGGDPVELQRHLIGALSRLSVVLVIVVASGVDAAISARRSSSADVASDGAAPVTVDA